MGGREKGLGIGYHRSPSGQPTAQATRACPLLIHSVVPQMAKKAASTKIGGEKKKKKPKTAGAEGVKGGSVKKVKKHRTHALLPQLEGEAAASKAEAMAKAAALKAKVKKRGGSLAALGGMRASLEEMLAAGEEKAASSSAGSAGVGLNAKKRLQLVADETANMRDVLDHPAFKSDPFGAIQAHLQSTVDAQHAKADERRRERVERNGGGLADKSGGGARSSTARAAGSGRGGGRRASSAGRNSRR